MIPDPEDLAKMYERMHENMQPHSALTPTGWSNLPLRTKITLWINQNYQVIMVVEVTVGLGLLLMLVLR